jgi:hypothetical protein
MSKKTRTKPTAAAKAVEPKKPVPFWKVVVGATLVLGVLAIYLNNYSSADDAPLQYAAEDVVRDRPIHAVHEMGGGRPIRFLAKDKPQPEISLPRKRYNFGTIRPRDVVRAKFVIRNTGQGPLTISRAFTTCGCTTADITARVIPPGKLAVVTVVFDAGFHDTKGQHVSRGVIIESNDPDNSKSEVWVEASVAMG